MNLKHVAIGASLVGGVCTGGYILHRSASSKGNSDDKKAEAPIVEVPPSKPTPAPKGSMEANTSVNYEDGTLGKQFADQLLDTESQEEK